MTWKTYLTLILQWVLAVFILCTTVIGCKPNNSNGFSQLLNNKGAPVVKPAKIRFPQDHGQHPEFGIEWWYLTANLTDQSNNPIWLQWTLFRTRTSQPHNYWSDGQFYMAHLSVHTEESHFAREKFAQGGVGNVAVTSKLMFIDNWQVVKDAMGRPARLILSEQDNVNITLDFKIESNVMLQGDEGYSEKYPGSELASYYYSLPDISVEGHIKMGTFSHQVKGNAWYDHEWSSAFLNQHFIGWQWFSLHFDEDSKLMLFALTPSNDSQLPVYWHGKYRTENNKTVSLLSQQIQLTSFATRKSKIGIIPSQWRLQIPDIAMDVEIRPMKREQISPFSILYYEGAVSISGTSTGVGFVEITQ